MARVTKERWVACAVRDEIAFGLLPGGELGVKTTICDEIRASGQPVIIDHVAADDHFRAHHTPALYGLQSYISMPIFLPNGAFFGTLCAIDPRPAKLNRPEIIGMFKNFAQLIAFHLEAQERAARQDAALLSERQTAELREQFIAVLGHDLRNPLASIDAGARLLLKQKPDEKSASLVGHIQNSVRRMAASDRRHAGSCARASAAAASPSITRSRRRRLAPAPALEGVASTSCAPRGQERARMETNFQLAHSVSDCDPARIAQLLSNLAANALKHGSGPVRILAKTGRYHAFELTVSNHGDPIPPETASRLFQPFFRTAQPSNQGLGLGLYIASEIARAHGGALGVESSAAETRFTLKIPRIASIVRPDRGGPSEGRL